RGIDTDLVGAGVDDAPRVLHSADAAADSERDDDLARGAVHNVDHRVAVVAGGGDVEEDELVGALFVVARGQLDGIAGVAQADEIDALDDAAGGDVEAGDDAFGEHGSDPHEVGDNLQSQGARLLGMELHAEEVGRLEHGGVGDTGVVAGGGRGVHQRAVEAVREVDVR